VRGLIQDHVASGVKLTCKDTFLTRSEFQQLLFIAVNGLEGTEIINHEIVMTMPPPTIFKPRQMWTGKQVISSILSHMCRKPLPPLNLDGRVL
jgi:DNA-directed RNA polymerase I subunit RPA1